jgi:hypothetical protein
MTRAPQPTAAGERKFAGGCRFGVRAVALKNEAASARSEPRPEVRSPQVDRITKGKALINFSPAI